MNDADEITDAIASRTFLLHSRVGNDKLEVQLIVGRPYFPDPVHEYHDLWRCDFQLLGIPGELKHDISGIDSLDSIMRAIRTAKIRLERFAAAGGWIPSWVGGEDFGLP